MADASTSERRELPDWWQREKLRRQHRLLIFLGTLGLLIAFFYWRSSEGVVGPVPGMPADTANSIAFVRQNDKGQMGLYYVRADGTGMRELTDPNDPSNKAQPVWTMDGKHLLYASNRNDARVTQIYILGADEPKQLTYGSGNKEEPLVNPNGTEAAFIAEGAVKTIPLNGGPPYQVMPLPRSGNADTSDDKALADDAVPTGPFLSASYSADGRGIAGAQDITNDPFSERSDLPPQGDQLITVLPPNSNKPLFLETGHEVGFAWSPPPDSARLVCAYTETEATGQDGKPQLVSGLRMWDLSSIAPDAPGGLRGRNRLPEPKNLFSGVGYSLEPKNVAWSPDGRKIAFEVWRLKGEGDRELRGIFIMDLNSGQPGAVVSPPIADKLPCTIPINPFKAIGKPQSPKWSPDGTRLLFELVRPDGKRDLWVIDADQTNPICLTKGVGDNYDAAWSPLK